MNTCEQCGSANESGESFCGVCGAFLEWEDKVPEAAATPVEPAAPEEQVPEPTAEPETPPALEPSKATLLDRVKAATGRADAAVAAAHPTIPRSPDVADVADVSGSQAAPLPTTAVLPTKATIQAAAAPPAAAPSKPGAPVTKAAAVRPGVAAPKPRRRELPPEDRDPLPGETVCPACGAGNVATRRFCRRCGADLVDAAVVSELPWYRRLFQRSPKAGPLAGDRPKRRRGRRRGYRRLVSAIVVLGIIGAGVWFALPHLGSVGNAVQDRISGSQVVNPTSITASSAAKGHPAAALRDGATNSYWSPAAPGAAKGQFIRARFADPIRLVSIQVFNGSSEVPKNYLTTARVATLAVSLTLEDGTITKLDPVTLTDAPGAQEIPIAVSDVTGVRLTVEAAYGASPNRRLAVGEIAFFKRS
ncbi:MAG: hypothetical protein L0H96_18395 [Humibacillus sp.]|nr:hypothetical protein [Humibacillus sp.]MDN5778869.1 hypothetical protein [Humibacillus sp.]